MTRTRATLDCAKRLLLVRGGQLRGEFGSGYFRFRLGRDYGIFGIGCFQLRPVHGGERFQLLIRATVLPMPSVSMAVV